MWFVAAASTPILDNYPVDLKVHLLEGPLAKIQTLVAPIEAQFSTTLKSTWEWTGHWKAAKTGCLELVSRLGSQLGSKPKNSWILSLNTRHNCNVASSVMSRAISRPLRAMLTHRKQDVKCAPKKKQKSSSERVSLYVCPRWLNDANWNAGNTTIGLNGRHAGPCDATPRDAMQWPDDQTDRRTDKQKSNKVQLYSLSIDNGNQEWGTR